MLNVYYLCIQYLRTFESQKFFVSNQKRYLFHPAGHVPHTEVFSAIMDDIHLDNLALIYIDSKTSELDTNLLYFAGTFIKIFCCKIHAEKL